MRRRTGFLAAAVVAAALALAACGGKSADDGMKAGSDSGSGSAAYQDEGKDAQAEAAGEGKNQTDGNLVQIGSVKDLEEFRERVNGGETALDAELTADLDLAEVCGEGTGSWTPIAEYNGTFEGNGHTIRGLYLATEEEKFAGLFGRTDVDAVIQNLALADVSVAGGEYAGAVAAYSEGVIRGCQVSGSVSAKRHAGGIAGAAVHNKEEEDPDGVCGSLEDCTNEAEVFSTEEFKNSHVGGIVGFTSGHIRNCVNTGAVHSECAAFAGGIAGEVEGTYFEAAGNLARMENCTNSGSVDGTWYVGGLVGYLGDGLIGTSKNTGTVRGYYEVGGIGGLAGGKKADQRGLSSMFVNCANTGEVQLYPMEANEDYKLAGEFKNDTTQEIGGIAARAGESAFVNCRNAGNLILETSHAFSGVGHIDRGESNLYLNCVSTGQIMIPSGEERADFIKKELMNAAGVYGSRTASLYYTGDACDETVEPVSQDALTDGTVLNALNAYPDGIPEEYQNALAESGIEFEVCGWKQGADGMPVLEWEE